MRSHFPHAERIVLVLDDLHRIEKSEPLQLLDSLIERLFDSTGGDEAQYTLEVRQSNDGAIALYERHGFVFRGLIEVPGGPTLHAMWRDPR